jgi:hypothetical protein
VHPGTIVAALEMDLTTARSVPPAPFFEDAVRSVQNAFVESGVRLDIGSTWGRSS